MTGWHDRRTDAAAAIDRLASVDRRRLVDALPVLAMLAGTVEDTGDSGDQR